MRTKSIAWLWVSILVTFPIFGQQDSRSELSKKIDDYIAPFAEVDDITGTLLVGQGDEIIYQRSWGLADRENEITFKPITSSCVASVTKPTTTIIAAKLLEDGTISLNDSVSKWIQYFPKGKQIEVQDLLFHRSGIPHRIAKDENVPRTPADMVELAKTSEFDFEPGTSRKYSSGGYSVLVRVLEVASGKTYEQLLSETILEPLELSNTFHPGPKTDLADAAKSYVFTVDGKKLAPKKHYSFLVGAGALFSTPQDLFKISRALVDGKFGVEARKRLLRGGKLRWNGITNSYRAFLEFDKKTDITIVLVSNQMTGANDLIRQNVPKIVAGQHVVLPVVPKPKFVKLSVDVLEKYAGIYNIAGSPMPVRARDGALYANEWILLPTSEETFFSPQDYGTINVIVADGRVAKLDWSGLECPRIGPLEK